MPNTLLPTQIGYTPATSPEGGTAYPSQVIIGRDIAVTFEAVGFGEGGRPDAISIFKINLTNMAANPPVQVGTLTFDANDLATILAANTNAPTPLAFTLKEVAVCESVDDEATEKRMVVLASQTYLP